MGLSSRLKEFLRQERVSYQVLTHPVSKFSALDKANEFHISGKEMLKSIVLWVDGKYVMCIVPAVYKLDLDKFREISKAQEVRLVKEDELPKLFPDCELGAESPFGHLYGMSAYCDKLITEDENVIFNGGSHEDLIQMNLKDFLRLEKPIIAEIGRHI